MKAAPAQATSTDVPSKHTSDVKATSSDTAAAAKSPVSTTTRPATSAAPVVPALPRPTSKSSSLDGKTQDLDKQSAGDNVEHSTNGTAPEPNHVADTGNAPTSPASPQPRPPLPAGPNFSLSRLIKVARRHPQSTGHHPLLMAASLRRLELSRVQLSPSLMPALSPRRYARIASTTATKFPF